jgi:chemotaxis protein histidine kinase CheA
VKVSVEKLGGSIRMESQPEEGAIFYVKIPNFLNATRNPESDTFAQARNLDS